MAASASAGPFFVYGDVLNLAAGVFAGATGVSERNLDAGPGGTYMGDGILDVRFFFPKDKVTGYSGTVPLHYSMPSLRSVSAVPAAYAVANIAAAANVANGTAMTLVTANAAGITVNVPYHVWSGALPGGTVTTAPITLDFGFEFGTTVAASQTVTVAASADFFLGQPIVIGGAGNSGGTAALLTVVTGTPTATTITIANAAVGAGTFPIGSGDLWGPSVVGFPTPLAALPWLAQGPGLFLDPRQTLTRAVSITGSTSATGGAFKVVGADIYGQTQTETITHAGGATTKFGKKAFKVITSVTPQFADAHNYSVGTSDVFGFCYRVNVWDDTDPSYGGTFVSTSTGIVAADTSSPATSTTGDVRGTLQVSTNGGGSAIAIGAAASNGTISSLVMTGNRVTLQQAIPIPQALFAEPISPQYLFGVTPA